jgi:hypothetical protein
VVRGFEPPPKPWLPGHRGVDLLGAPGQQVRAAAGGTVVYAGTLAGRGVVVVSHGATRTTYEPVVSTTQVGATLAGGDPIGTLSAAGSHCPPRACLHWGLRRADAYLDPLSLLRAAPVRLLPTGLGAGDRAAAGTRDVARGGPSATADPAAAPPQTTPPGPPADGASAEEGSSAAGAAVVGLAALVTIAGGVLIRRH